MRRLPFQPGRARQRLHLRRGRQRDRDRLPRLPRHGAAPTPTCAPRGPAAPPQGPRPRAAPQRGRPAPLRMDRARRPPGPDPALDRRSEPRMGGEPGPRQRRSSLPPCRPPATRRRRPCFNLRSARAKLMARIGRRDRPLSCSARASPDGDLAHPDSEMACFTCHLSWTTSCGGCHLPIEANWQHRDPPLRRRGDAQLRDLQPAGRARRHVPARPAHDQQGQHHRPGPLDLGADPVLDQHQPRADLRPAAADLGGRLLEPGVRAALPAHGAPDRDQDTARDCHLSAANDNNAIMAQLLLQGTNYVNFVGLHAWIGLDGGFEAVRVTEWDEPQAVIGSYLHRYAYPDYYRLHVERNHRELINWTRGETFDRKLSAARRSRARNSATSSRAPAAASGCLQKRGEYMFVAEGQRRLPRLSTSPAIANKGFSERIVTAPFSPLGQDTHVALARTRPAWRCRPTSRSRRRATSDGADDGRGRTAARCRCATPTRSSASTRSTIMRWSPTPRRA